MERASLKSANSFESAKSQPSTPIAAPTRAQLEQLERNAPRKFSSEIEAISEKLYHLNNMVKMNKDLEVLAKENLVKSDILNKLTLKEKWLAENAAIAAGMANPMKAPKAIAATSAAAPPKSKFDEKYEKIVSAPQPATEPKPKPKPVIDFNLDELKPRKPNFEERPKELLKKPESLKKPTQLSPKPERKSSANVSRSSSTKSNASSKSSPRLRKAPLPDDSKMQIEKILGAIKKPQRSEVDEDMDIDDDDDAYVDSQSNTQLSSKLKEIGATSFAGTMDHIKSQLITPTVHTANVDLSKYFPNQKEEKSAAGNTNKNQKTLKDVDLAKYFPSSPAPQRRAVETVAERLKKSQTEAAIPRTPEVQAPQGAQTDSKTDSKTKPVPPKRQASLNAFSLRDHQLDGALDLSKKKAPVKVVTATKAAVKTTNSTTLAKATTTPKGKIKIIKKIVPKGTKAKKAAAAAAAAVVPESQVPPRDEAERILDEILADGETRSPSSEYQKLFNDEKSPSDLSDKIERILEETGLDLELGLPRRNSKKLLKTKSLGEGDFDLEPKRLSGVQNILKRFESMSSVNSQQSDEQSSFKLRRMESSTSNMSSLNRSRESLVSASDSMSDLEKTMDYLRNEWRNEATNFLQKKRDKFYAQKEEQQKELEIKAETSRGRELPVQYRDSKLAKFFGLASRKSPEKRKSPIKKQKSPTKKQSSPSKIQKPAKTNNSLEELAKISNARQAKQAQKTPSKAAPKIKKVEPKKPASPAPPVPDDLEILHLLDKATEAKELELERSKTKSPLVEEVSLPAANEIVNIGTETAASRPIVEDIKNLPKTGCDKSLNSSRRGSQSSLVLSRRQSDISLTEKLNLDALEALHNIEMERDVEHVDEVFQSMVEAIDQTPDITVDDDLDADSLCTTISKSPSAQPVTVVKRGSSEEESIEKLFSKFSDEMLVDVEFDSNDELIGISPRSSLIPGSSAERDFVDKLESLERDEAPLRSVEELNRFTSGQNAEFDELPENHFPARPQRRQKSSSSSSEPTLPVAPQRLKKKLAKLDPEDMPPSVQDLLQKLHVNNVQSEQVQMPTVTSDEKPKFPTLLPNEDIVDHVDKGEDVVDNVKKELPKINANGFNKEKPVGDVIPEIIIEQPQHPLAKSVQVQNNNPIKSDSSSHSSLNEPSKLVTPPKARSKENSLDWDMEKLPASPMPRRKQPLIPASKEGSLEWDMEKLPNSPMPLRRRLPVIKPSDVSPSSSIQLLNNLPSVDDDQAMAEARLIQEFELERRQALIKRDESFEATAAEQRRRDSLQSSSNSSGNSNGKRSLPPPTPPQTSVRRGTTQASSSRRESTRREGTPPMFKKLDLGDDSNSTLDSTADSTRRSSFAFIELQDNKPVIVPMPKKLHLPKLEAPKYVPEARAEDEPVPEVFKDRAWPNPYIGDLQPDSEDEEDAEQELKKQLPEYARSDSPPCAAFQNRQWPDGKTIFEQSKRSDSLEVDDVIGFLDTKRRKNKRFNNKPRSQSPQPFKPLGASARLSSKSFGDLKSGPSVSTSQQSLSALSSQDTDTRSTTTTVATSRPLSNINYADPVDANMRALLDRSKRLHDRKRDFVNERVVERNPYMRDVIRSTDRSDYMPDDQLSSYRPRHYTSSLPAKPTTTTTTSRFPSSTSAYARSPAPRSNYDYLNSGTTSSDYLSRRPYTTLGASTTSNYYPTTAATSSTHLSDLFRRRSPASMSSYGRSDYGLPASKESCVIS